MDTNFLELRKLASEKWPLVENLRNEQLKKIREDARESIEQAIEDGRCFCLVVKGMKIKKELEDAGFFVRQYMGTTAEISWEG